MASTAKYHRKYQSGRRRGLRNSRVGGLAQLGRAHEYRQTQNHGHYDAGEDGVFPGRIREEGLALLLQQVVVFLVVGFGLMPLPPGRAALRYR